MRSRWRTRPGASWAVSRSGSKGTPPIRPGVRSAGLRPASTAERRSQPQPPPAHSGHRRGTSRPVDGTTAWNAGFSRHPLGESSERRPPAGIDGREAVETAASTGPQRTPEGNITPCRRDHGLERGPPDRHPLRGSSERRPPAGIDGREAVEIAASTGPQRTPEGNITPCRRDHGLERRLQPAPAGREPSGIGQPHSPSHPTRYGNPGLRRRAHPSNSLNLPTSIRHIG